MHKGRRCDKHDKHIRTRKCQALFLSFIWTLVFCGNSSEKVWEVCSSCSHGFTELLTVPSLSHVYGNNAPSPPQQEVSKEMTGALWLPRRWPHAPSSSFSTGVLLWQCGVCVWQLSVVEVRSYNCRIRRESRSHGENGNFTASFVACVPCWVAHILIQTITRLSFPLQRSWIVG